MPFRPHHQFRRLPVATVAVVAVVAVVVVAFWAATPMRGHAGQAGSGGSNRAEHLDKPYVILVSLDGFKSEYLDRWDLPNFKRAMTRGTRAQWMQPVFPSLTFPNHYSLVTGVHPQKHGIVSNRFWDPVRKAQYVYTDNAIVTQPHWYLREPIWVTAERQGMVAACYFWPGSEAPIDGVRPTIYNTYSDSVPNEARVKTVLEWLRMAPDKRPHLITLYFSELDTASHSAPLGTPGVLAAGQSLDRAVGQLMDGIDALPIRDEVYVLLTSDHGMVDTSARQTVQLTSLLDASEIADLVAAYSGPVANLHVRGGESRARALNEKINAGLRNGRSHLRHQLPERFHYTSNPRAGDIIVVMNEAWGLSAPRIPSASPPRSLPAAVEKPGQQPSRPEVWGAHGWDNELPSMRALFLAWGPAIRAGATVDPVRNVDVYPFIAEVLGLQPAADLDGRPGYVRGLITR
jgi:predicted AlkP superfamily pyrophosphatase or phosphodiesterase